MAGVWNTGINGRFALWEWGRECVCPGTAGVGTVACGLGPPFAGRSVRSPLVRWRLGRRQGFLTPQVGAGNDPSQNAQPRLHLRSLLGGVLRGRSPRVLPAAGPRVPGVPARPRRSVLSRLVSHILSLMACDRVSVLSRVVGIRIISFTSHRFGLVWAFGVFADAAGECAPTGRWRETTCEGYQP